MTFASFGGAGGPKPHSAKPSFSFLENTRFKPPGEATKTRKSTLKAALGHNDYSSTMSAKSPFDSKKPSYGGQKGSIKTT